MCLALPVANNEIDSYVFEWLHSVVLRSMAVPSSDIANVFLEIYMTDDALCSIFPSGVVGCTGSRLMCVLGYMATTVARLYFRVAQCSVLTGSRCRACCSIIGDRVKIFVLVHR